MDESVNQDVAVPAEVKSTQQVLSDKELNFRRLEQEREREREARIRAEMQAQMMQQEIENIKQLLKPKEKDPLDDIGEMDDTSQIKAKFQKKLDLERATFERKAEEIARKTYEEQKKQDEQKNYLQRLKSEFRDYDDVMTENNIASLEQQNPVFLKAILQIGDEYERRKLAYEYLRAGTKKPDESSIKNKVEENQKNPYFIPASTGTPTAVEFDIRSKSARDQAYQKLKQAQRGPIGNSQASMKR